MTKFDSRQGEHMGNCEENKQEKKKLEDYVRSIPDFPEEGIIFREDVYKRQLYSSQDSSSPSRVIIPLDRAMQHNLLREHLQHRKNLETSQQLIREAPT